MATATLERPAVMTREQQMKAVERKLLKKEQTARELAAKLGLSSGQAISRSLTALVDEGRALVNAGRTPTYTKP